MRNGNTGSWELLEQWSPRLFLLASVIFLVAFAVTFLRDSVGFSYRVVLTVAIGLLVSLLAVGGLSAQMMNRNSLVGRLSRVVVSLAIFFAIGLLTFGILDIVGYSSSLVAIFVFGTIFLPLVTYALFGGGIILTGAYSSLIGSLLLAATGALLVAFFGQLGLPQGLIGTVGEGGLFVTHIAIWYLLRAEPEQTDRAESAPHTVGK